MADPAGLFQCDLVAMETMIAGAIGGFFLCLGRFIATLSRVHGHQPMMKQFLLAHIPPLIVLPILGGGLAWLTIGASGAFLTGLGALGFILLATGPHPHESQPAPQEANNVSAPD
jgi:hypothetical protein